MILTVGEHGPSTGTVELRWGKDYPTNRFYGGSSGIVSIKVDNGSDGYRDCGLSVEEARSLGDALHQAASDATFRRPKGTA